MKRSIAALCGLALVASLGPGPARAQDPKTLGWFLTSEFSGIWTSGNTQVTSLGVSAELIKKAEQSKLKIQAGTVQSYVVKPTRTAVGTAEDYELRDNNDRDKTVDQTSAQVRYDRDLSKRFFTFGGVDWLRNPLAGVDSRFVFFAGAGNIWIDSEETRFRTDFAATYTVEDEVVANPIVDTNFPGLRVGSEFFHKISETTEFKSNLTLDFNLKESEDIRGEWKGSLPVTISKTFLLSPSLKLLWRNQPPLGDITLYNESEMMVGTVSVPLHRWDSIAAISLVAKFE